MLRRHVDERLRRTLAGTPAVLLAGARGAGKSTLARTLAADSGPARLLSLDDPLDLADAARDPALAVAGSGLVVIDEAERLPALLAVVSAAVARDPTPGRFLLTASVLGPALRAFLGELGKRAAVVPLWSLSAGELVGEREGFLEALLAPLPRVASAPFGTAGDLAARLLRGGFPAPQDTDPRDGRAFLGDRLGAVLERDVRALAHLDTLAELPRLLAATAGASGAAANLADLARVAGVPQTTLKRHLALLEATFLLHRVPAWDGGGRAVRGARLVPTDVGLACHLLRLDAARLAEEPAHAAALVPAYVVGELLRQASWGSEEIRVAHFATYGGDAVDAVVEASDGRIAAVSVCPRESVAPGDARGLAALARLAGSRFTRGVVLHLGGGTAELGEHLVALPLSALWSAGTSQPATPAPVPPAAPPDESGRPPEPVRTSGCIWDPGAGW